MIFNKEILRETSKVAAGSSNYREMVELTDEELDSFYQAVIGTEHYTFAHNSEHPTTAQDGRFYTMKTVRGPSLDALIWYVRTCLNSEYSNGKFDGNPVFIYIVGKTVINTFDTVKNEYGGTTIVEKTDVSYFVRMSSGEDT